MVVGRIAPEQQPAGIAPLELDQQLFVFFFQPLEDAEIDEYVASREPMDKAGAYAIQGLASKFVGRIEGCYFNVVGLPISAVYRHLRELA